MRELAVRGVDGPGLHILDVSPASFQHNEGEQAGGRWDCNCQLAAFSGDG